MDAGVLSALRLPIGKRLPVLPELRVELDSAAASTTARAVRAAGGRSDVGKPNGTHPTIASFSGLCLSFHQRGRRAQPCSSCQLAILDGASDDDVGDWTDRLPAPSW